MVSRDVRLPGNQKLFSYAVKKYKVGDIVKAKVIDVDYDKKRVSLSMKELIEKPEETIPELAEEPAEVEEAE